MVAPLAAAAPALGRIAAQAGASATRGAAQGVSEAGKSVARAGQSTRDAARAVREAGQATRSMPRTGGARMQNWQRTQGKQNGARLQQQLKQRAQEQKQGGQDEKDGQQQSQSAVDKMLQRPLAQVLQKMWIACATIKGALLGLPYIHFHFVMHYMGGPFAKFFCAPGEEWDPTQGAGGMSASATPLPKLLGYGEIITVLVVDAIIAFIIAALILIIYLITHPLEAAKLGFEVFAQML